MNLESDVRVVNVVASTKDARREGGIMPTLSIGNSISSATFCLLIFIRRQFPSYFYFFCKNGKCKQEHLVDIVH